ncbi:MAG: hypothetical protein HYX47_00315 [Burkholderiales bacterium]|nr:hypothetical protein [Burkholderiales bacterium]
MNNASNDAFGGREKPAGRRETAAPEKTPATDMQPEDTGTPESGNGSAGAMKQTSKTPHESGNKQ